MTSRLVRRTLSIIKDKELAEFDEVGACGTAAVISPICSIIDQDGDKVHKYCREGKAGPYSTMLYNKLRGIQLGEEPDPYGWTTIIE